MVNKFRGSSFWNYSPNIPHPKFFHIISSSDELCRLRIPVVFANRYCKDMLNPVFLEAPHGKAWEIEVEYSQDQIWLAGGWKEFSDYYSISINHVLIFTYNPRAHFDVTIINQRATEIEYPIDQDIESDDSMDISDHYAENLSHGPLVEESEEEDDIPMNIQTNANVIEQEEGQEISEGYEEHEQQPNIIGADQEVGEANSRSEEVGPKNSSRYSSVNLNDDNPYFEIIIKKAHTTSMTIPMRFAKRTGIINMKNMMLVNEEGTEWGVKIKYNGRMVIIKRGWAEFRKHNKIANGETCRFKLIHGHAANALQVQKIPTPHSLQ